MTTLNRPRYTTQAQIPARGFGYGRLHVRHAGRRQASQPAHARGPSQPVCVRGHAVNYFVQHDELKVIVSDASSRLPSGSVGANPAGQSSKDNGQGRGAITSRTAYPPASGRNHSMGELTEIGIKSEASRPR